MLVSTAATDVRQPVEVVDSNNAPATGLTYLSAITFAYLRPADSSWQSVTLASGTSAHTDGGFRVRAGNVYEFCWPDAAIVAGESTLVRYIYDGVTHYDVIEARLSTVSGITIVSAATTQPNDAGSFTIRQLTDYHSDTQRIGPFQVVSELDLTTGVTLRWGATKKIGFSSYVARTETTQTFVGTADATAVDGEVDTYEIYLSATAAELDKEPGAYGWNCEAVITSGGRIQDIIFGECTLLPSFGDHA